MWFLSLFSLDYKARTPCWLRWIFLHCQYLHNGKQLEKLMEGIVIRIVVLIRKTTNAVVYLGICLVEKIMFPFIVQLVGQYFIRATQFMTWKCYHKSWSKSFIIPSLINQTGPMRKFKNLVNEITLALYLLWI